MFSFVNVAPAILLTVSCGGMREKQEHDKILFRPVSEYYSWRKYPCPGTVFRDLLGHREKAMSRLENGARALV